MKIFRKVAMALAVVFICSGFMSITSHAGEYILFENPEGFGYYSYAEMYPDLYQAYGYDKAKLWSHYVNNGYEEGRIAMVDRRSILTVENFDAARYASENPDVVAALGTDPYTLLMHYKNNGYLEGRQVYSTDPRIQGVLDACNVADNITNSSMSDMQKVLAIHDWMCYNLTYDYTYSKYSYLNAISEGTAVCQGYAELFDLFMHIVGIESKIVTGYGTNGIQSGLHAWNEVVIDGVAYAIDVTWDDMGEYGIPVRYNYFLISPEQMSADHWEDSYYVAYKYIFIHQ